MNMTIPVDVWLRGEDVATTKSIENIAREPGAWTDDDVRQVLEGMLGVMHRLKHPGDAQHVVQLRGLSWIVNSFEGGGVVIAIEITMGAAIAGATSNNEGLMNTGLAAATAGTSVDTYNQFAKAHLATKTGNLNEFTDHVFNPFAVPAAGYARKWILINTPKNRKFSKINLTLETIDGDQKKYAVKI